MTKQIDLREGAKRQHRSVAMLCSLYCHHFDLDGVVIYREEIEWIIGLQRFKKTRIEWMREDFAEYFPFQNFQMTESVDGTPTLSLITLSRVPKCKEAYITCFSLGAHPRSLDLKESILKVFGLCSVNTSELLVTSVLNMLASGQISLSDLFGRERGDLLVCPPLDDFRTKAKNPMMSRAPKTRPKRAAADNINKHK
jgi:hypothetical protein